MPMPPVAVEEHPDRWKTEGNAKLTVGDNTGALECYTHGIHAAQEAGVAGKSLSQLYSMRAQAHYNMGNHEQAVEDCEKAITLDGSNGKAYWRGGSAALKLQRPEVARDLCQRGMKMVGDSPTLKVLLEEAESQLAASSDQKTVEAAPEQTNTKASAGLTGTPLPFKDMQLPPTLGRGSGPGVLQGGTVVQSQDIADRGASLLARYRSTPTGARDEDDVVRAKRLFETCLRQEPDNETALLGLGDLFNDGLGVSCDRVLASKLWTKALQNGSVKAHMRLCVQALGSWATTARAAALEGGEPPPGPSPG